MKNLQQAIDHARQVYEPYRNTAPECYTAMEHLQLANWLEELQRARKTLGLPDFTRDTCASEMIRISDLLKQATERINKLEDMLRSALDDTPACVDCILNDRIKQILGEPHEFKITHGKDIVRVERSNA